jgi:prophage antirepressor-like protein
MEIVKAFNSNELHTDIVIKGTFEEPLFRSSDIGLVLEMSNINKNIIDFDETEKVSIITNTNGGNQLVSFLTEKGLYKVLFRSRKPIAETFQNWVCQVIKDIRIKGTYTLQQQLADKEQQIQEIKHENIILQKKIEESTDNVPTIYIWNTNTQIKTPELKIGITLNVHKRIKPYKQINKHGKIEFTTPILNVDIKIFEKVIHSVLNPYKVQDEVFKIDVEEAKLVIINFVNFIKLTQITNDSERINKIQKVYEQQNRIINNIQNNISTNEVSIQTEQIDNNFIPDEIEEIRNKIIDNNSERIQKK